MRSTDVVSVLARFHHDALSMLAHSSATPIATVHEGINLCRASLPNKIRNQVLKLDNAYKLMRHVTGVYTHGLLDELHLHLSASENVLHHAQSMAGIGSPRKVNLPLTYEIIDDDDVDGPLAESTAVSCASSQTTAQTDRCGMHSSPLIPEALTADSFVAFDLNYDLLDVGVQSTPSIVEVAVQCTLSSSESTFVSDGSACSECSDDDCFIDWLCAWRARFAASIPSVAEFGALLTEVQAFSGVWVDRDTMMMEASDDDDDDDILVP